MLSFTKLEFFKITRARQLRQGMRLALRNIFRETRLVVDNICH